MPPKRKSFTPLEWMELNSDNEWEPSVIPSCLSKKRPKIEGIGRESGSSAAEEGSSPLQFPSDNENEDSVNTPSEQQYLSEEFVDMTSSDEEFSTRHHDVFAEEDVDMTSDDDPPSRNVLDLLEDEDVYMTSEDDKEEETFFDALDEPLIDITSDDNYEEPPENNDSPSDEIDDTNHEVGSFIYLLHIPTCTYECISTPN